MRLIRHVAMCELSARDWIGMCEEAGIYRTPPGGSDRMSLQRAASVPLTIKAPVGRGDGENAKTPAADDGVTFSGSVKLPKPKKRRGRSRRVGIRGAAGTSCSTCFWTVNTAHFDNVPPRAYHHAVVG